MSDPRSESFEKWYVEKWNVISLKSEHCAMDRAVWNLAWDASRSHFLEEAARVCDAQAAIYDLEDCHGSDSSACAERIRAIS
jgi:hypothetical protein